MLRFRLEKKAKYTTNKGQEVGFSHWGISDEGVRKYKELHERYAKESRDEKRGILVEWDEHTEDNGITMEYKNRKKRKVSKDEIH